VSAVQQEPVLVERGGTGEEATLLLELKLLADVALVGLPNAGKSALLSWCSAAKPKVAPYPFTTTEPVLGVVETRGKSFVMMEVPGLIEGAHLGRGLGHEFLRHTERARVLVHVVDGTADDLRRSWDLVNQEMASFDPGLVRKPQIVAVNKVDIPEVGARLAAMGLVLAATGKPVVFVSAVTGEGVDALLAKTLELLDSVPPPHPPARTARPSPVVNPQHRDRTFNITREGDAYVVDAPAMDRLVPLADLRDRRAILQIWKELQRLGVVKALEEAGVRPGDTVRLGSAELEWY
jgi:GTP-binding protein